MVHLYNVIYADPPWSYKNKRTGYGGASDHYNTMECEDIERLPVQAISDKDCILFLWATFPKLQEALRVIEAWGFTYKTLGFSWIKTNRRNGKPCFGMGHYTKSNCEVCLIATKGRPKVVNNTVSSVVISLRQEHSRKPEAVREGIEKLVGQSTRKIELFARRRSPGWDVWGNEVSSSIQL